MARNPIPYRVECQSPPFAVFETIAAFNVDTIAASYMRGCQASNPRNVYRVVDSTRRCIIAE